MDNQIRHVTRQEYEKIAAAAKGTSTFVGELDGRDIHDLDDFLDAVWTVFRFPDGPKNPDAYLDWIRDLRWIGAEGYIFTMLDFKDFMDQDPHFRGIILETLESMVIPWWSEDVEKYEVEGKAQPFNVYLVD
ncbi:MAG: barstar family protein [Coriobacteriales bacterium]|jgi:hypothetical protein|nr:barstar family protein [Coriobacteriales bacterium]